MELGDLRRLDAAHDLTGFDAGPTDTEGQSAWLRERRLGNDRRGLTRVFVAPHLGLHRVAAFFGLSAAAISREVLPRPLRPYGTPRIIPATLIARLAVDRAAQGRDLMLAALGGALEASDNVGSAFVVVDVAGEKAQRLYAHHMFTAIDDVKGCTTTMVVPLMRVAALFRAP